MTIKTKPTQILQVLIVTMCATLGTSSVCFGETLHVNRNKVVADVAPTITRMAKDRQLKPGLNLLYIDRQTGTGIFAETDHNKVRGFMSRTRDGKYLPLKLWRGEKSHDGGFDIRDRYSSEISYNDLSNCNLAIVFPDAIGYPEPYICFVPSGYQSLEIVRPYDYERERYGYYPYYEYESYYREGHESHHRDGHESHYESHESHYQKSQYPHASSPAGTTRSSSFRKGR